MKIAYSNQSTSSEFGGRRGVLLLLLFALSIYQLINSGFPAFAVICAIPIVVLVVILGCRQSMSLFWILFIVNYFLHFAGRHRYLPAGIPTSLYDEALEVLLLMMAVIDSTKDAKFGRSMNLMMLGIVIWCSFGLIEIFNDTCGLGYNVGAWFAGYRLLCFQLMWIILVFTVYINTPERLKKLIYLWAGLSLFSAFWTYKQKNMGFTPAESAWLQSNTTHILQGGSLIRYFSTFSDAANYGCNAAATATTFIVLSITTRLKRERLFFLFTALVVMWGMFQSGTRTAIFCLGFGLAVFIVLSKSVKIAVPSAIVFGLMAFFLIFTNIGNGNQQIRRMRSAFNKNEASTNQRKINQAVMKKYMADAPWGIGIGMGMDNVPSNNKFRKLSTLPPDSEYIFIWIRTGVVGISVFLVSMAIMFMGACWIVFFKLKNRSLMGVGAGICGAFAAMQLGGYGNQVLYQYPNGLIFFGTLAVVYILPKMEPEWVAYEEKLFAKQQERERLKLEKKRASRV